MNQEEFILALNTLYPDCNPDAAWSWVAFAVKSLDTEQFAHFIPTKDHASAVGSCLDTTYAGLYAVRQKYGSEIGRKVADMGCRGRALYQGEMMQAAEVMKNGGNAKLVWNMIASGQIESEPPFFFNLPDEAALTPLGPEIGVTQSSVPCGLGQKRIEPGFLLADGTVLLESERDSFGRYRGGAGMDGMYLQTGRLYAPVRKKDGRIRAFREVRAVAGREREAAFLRMDNGAAIYRLNPPEQANPDGYVPVTQLQKSGESPLRGNYCLIHITPIASTSTPDSLITSYQEDLALHPGDIVAVKKMDVLTCWYVDQLTYSKLPGLLENHLKAVELSAEQNCNQIDGIINNEAPKPSLRDTLHKFQEAADQSKDTIPPDRPRPGPER